MEEGREMYYRSTPEKIAMAEENSEIKWRFQCAACRNRAPFDSGRDCAINKQWQKGVGCHRWSMDPDIDPEKPFGI